MRGFARAAAEKAFVERQGAEVHFFSAMDRAQVPEHLGIDRRGNQPFDPAMMLKILIYGYASGTFSSRRIAKKLEEDVAFRVLAAGNFPEHRTICDFRKDNLNEFVDLFKQVVQIAKSSGLVKLGRTTK